jgi:hypothetical protein
MMNDELKTFAAYLVTTIVLGLLTGGKGRP